MTMNEQNLTSSQTMPHTETRNTTGFVSRIQRFCVHDGPGIRSTVFLSGCPLRCAWCHNPECWEADESADLSDVDTVMQTVLRDRTFYRNSGGGMTLSGGEPSAQPEFSLALLRAAHTFEISSAIESAGTGDASFYRTAMELGCLFLYDIKHMDPVIHHTLCGMDNEQILQNLHMLFDWGANICVRMPLIPGENDTEENIASCCAFLQRHHCQVIELMPYHNSARGKYASHHLKPRYDAENATPEQIHAACVRFSAHGIKTKVSGQY